MTRTEMVAECATLLEEHIKSTMESDPEKIDADIKYNGQMSVQFAVNLPIVGGRTLKLVLINCMRRRANLGVAVIFEVAGIQQRKTLHCMYVEDVAAIHEALYNAGRSRQ